MITGTASIKTLTTAAAVACIASFASGAAAADLDVHIEGLNAAEGKVRVALHRQAPGSDDIADADVIAGSFRVAAAGSLRIVFADVTPGAYAVAAFHDADDDGDLATNFLGMPTEGYGFSNGAVGFMGPPGFEAASFTVDADADRVSVSVPIAYPHTQEQETRR